MAQFEVTAVWTFEGTTTIEADNIDEARELAWELGSWEFDQSEELSDSLEVIDVEETAE